MEAEKRLGIIALLAEDQAWDAIVLIGRILLEDYYPGKINGSSSDGGPKYVVALRNAIAHMDGKRPEQMTTVGEHTPGPWPRPRFYPSELGFYGWWELGHIASCNRKADARLIAAAPELFEYVVSAASAGSTTAKALVDKIVGSLSQGQSDG